MQQCMWPGCDKVILGYFKVPELHPRVKVSSIYDRLWPIIFSHSTTVFLLFADDPLWIYRRKSINTRIKLTIGKARVCVKPDNRGQWLFKKDVRPSPLYSGHDDNCFESKSADSFTRQHLSEQIVSFFYNKTTRSRNKPSISRTKVQ